MDLVSEILQIAAAFDQAEVGYAVCGGVAVTAYGAPRSTEDVDVLVLPADVQRALDAVRPLGYVFVALPLRFDEGSPQAREVQRVTKIDAGQHLVLDLLHASGPFEGSLDDAVTVELSDGALRLVSLQMLRKMKRLAGRPKDLGDLAALEEQES